VNALRHFRATAVVSVLMLSGCSAPHGQPNRGSEALAPNEILEFGTLYADNCAGCHGPGGRGGAAIALANPVYLAIADDAVIRERIANGVKGTAMPAFARASGGLLTDKQIDAILAGIRSRWSKGNAADRFNPPSYTAQSSGDADRGGVAYRTYCESCHGPEGRGGSHGSAITNDSFLALVSDQGLRSVIIGGRPELGAPDWRSNVPDRPMSEQDVTDVVAWLASHRVRTPGQPYAVSNDLQR
jgi:cytochrome c oxidase cbb3-type subunit III